MDPRAVWEDMFGRPEPGKIVCVGLNYRDHAMEYGAALPAEPLLFGKFANTLRGPGEPIVLPSESAHVDAEAELAVVIGSTARRLSPDDALDAVAAYTCANDVTARDFQAKDGQWLRAKGFDSFCPIGPELVPAVELGEAGDLRIAQRLNGETLQDSRTSSLIFPVRRIVSHASQVFTLEPGDLLLTGTPAGVGVHREPPVSLQPGDTVEIEIESIGILSNPVQAPQP
jgi:2-keto-4-pentenoate hydratase/2-oxohepta-3-ene-1,7-dioic acid hydratase in catechol pathway